MTIGLFDSAVGQIGVIIRAGSCGWMIGPPAESEWPVEPVGVATITPSALKLIIFRWSIVTASLINLAKFPWLITASLRATKVLNFLLSR